MKLALREIFQKEKCKDLRHAHLHYVVSIFRMSSIPNFDFLAKARACLNAYMSLKDQYHSALSKRLGASSILSFRVGAN